MSLKIHSRLKEQIISSIKNSSDSANPMFVQDGDLRIRFDEMRLELLPKPVRFKRNNFRFMKVSFYWKGGEVFLKDLRCDEFLAGDTMILTGATGSMEFTLEGFDS